MPSNFLNPLYVQMELDRIGTTFFSVTFAKKDGTVTTRAGRTRTYSRRVDPATADAESVLRAQISTDVLARDGAVFVDYADPAKHDGKPGFRFDLDRVVAIGEIAARH